MTRKDWDAWLTNWLGKHPPRMPASAPDPRFTEEVMSRIRAEQAPASVLLRSIPRPRLSFALGGALAAVLAVALWIQRPALLLHEIERDSNFLLEAGEFWTWSPASPEEDWQEMDRIVLAQAVEKRGSTPEKQEIFQLWEDEDLSDELQWLDQMELA